MRHLGKFSGLVPLLLAAVTALLTPVDSKAAAHCFCSLLVGGQNVSGQSYSGYTQAWPKEKARCQQACRDWHANGISQGQLVAWAQQTTSANPYACVSVQVNAHVGTQSDQNVVNTSVRIGNPCPNGGSYDGANCLVATPPGGAKAFLLDGNFYYPFLSSNPATQCPLGSSDTANCFLGYTPEDAVPFLYQNRYYYSATCNAGVEWVDRGAVKVGSGFLGASTKATKFKATASGSSFQIRVVGKGLNKDSVNFPFFTISAGNPHVFGGLKSGRKYCLEAMDGSQAHCYVLP